MALISAPQDHKNDDESKSTVAPISTPQDHKNDDESKSTVAPISTPPDHKKKFDDDNNDDKKHYPPAMRHGLKRKFSDFPPDYFMDVYEYGKENENEDEKDEDEKEDEKDDEKEDEDEYEDEIWYSYPRNWVDDEPDEVFGDDEDFYDDLAKFHGCTKDEASRMIYG